MVAMRREDGSYSKPQLKKKPAKDSGAPNWMWPVAVTVVSLAAIGVGGFLYFTKLEALAPSKVAAASSASPAPPAAAAAPPAAALPAAAPTPVPAATAAMVPPPSPPMVIS